VVQDTQRPPASVVVQPWNEHNQALAHNVHPSDWVNPEPADRYNLVVIGGGTAGLVTAVGAVGLEAKVALVERDLMGGDCLNTGCVPPRRFIRAARAWADVGMPKDSGEVPSGSNFPPSGCAGCARISNRLARRFRDLGVDVFLGEGRFSVRPVDVAEDLR
jgi:pyruvate/2-oxoglutarate dehydrogenase complex dihydrolipoamide dehydrogenase (E3) component